MRNAKALLLAILAVTLACGAPVPVIFDTDMGNDIDDALALAMIHSLESLGEARLIAVTVTKDNPYAAAYIDVVNRFYGRPSIPIGVVKNGKTPQDNAMIRVPVERKKADGSPVYARGSKPGDAVDILKQVLEKAADRSVAIVQVGFSTNLARLLDDPKGKELARRKVRILSVMGGEFAGGKPEYNIKTDVDAARKLFAEWPTPVVASGHEVGVKILYPASSIEKDYGWTADHPVVDAYRAYKQMPYDRPTWDLTSVLYAVRPDAGYFSLSPNGRIAVEPDGATPFTPGAGNHRYLIASAEQRAKVLAELIRLASRPPGR